MKKCNSFFVMSLFFILVSFQNDTANSFVVNTEYSKVNWKGYKIGSEHTGEVALKEGNLLMEDGKLTGGKFVIDMSTITCTDLKEEEENKKLVSHLKSADFFGTTDHPTATFVINKTIPYGKEKVKDQDFFKETYKLVGEITIKGITKPLKTQVDIYDYDTSLSAVARLKIDRSDFDIRYGSGSFFDDLGDKIIYDEIQLDVNISAAPAK